MSAWQPIATLPELPDTDIVLWNPCDGVHLLEITTTLAEIFELREGDIFTHWRRLESPDEIEPDLKELAAFAENIKVYMVDGDEDHLHVKLNDRVVDVMPISSPNAVLWLALEAQRKAVLAKANGGA